MSLAFNRSLNEQVARPEAPLTECQGSSLSVAVIFTTVDSTTDALKKAGSLAESLGVEITLMVPQIVPYPLPLTSPPVLLEFQERRFDKITSESLIEIRVQLYLCRDALQTLKTVLKPHSLVVIGGRKRFWPTREKALARKLRSAGHEVIFAETE